MKIGIISDTHDNIWRLADAIPYLQKTDAVLHCGDLCAPFIMQKLKEGVGEVPVHVVWGNNDGDKKLISDRARDFPNTYLHGEFAEIEIDGLRIAMNHYPEIAHGMAYSQKYDLVCFGHNHTGSMEKVGKTILLNPGEMLGMGGSSTMVFFDTGTRQVESIELWRENN